MGMDDRILQDLLFPPVLTLIFALICYWRLRSLRHGGPLTPLLRTLLVCLCLFALGAAYAILFQDQLALLARWRGAWIALIVGWGVVLALLVWRQSWSR
jgi:hypothetical protein